MKVAIIIPCYKVKNQILNVLNSIGSDINTIYVVDDACPVGSGRFVQENCSDPRVKVVFHEENKGVGGAVMTGYQHALADGAEIMVKLDGDGQMDSSYIPKLIKPILNGEADYTKGNRFFDIEKLLVMPRIRLIGNSMLSLVNKMVNGYWNIVDPTNGFTAIHYKTLEMLPTHKIDKRYFFESDMLFRLSIVRAVVKDIPMPAIYGDEKSNLKISKVLWEFPIKYHNRFFKRLFYNYFLRDFNPGTIQILVGFLLLVAGVVFGIVHWVASYQQMVATPTGTIMISALLVILGFQLLLGALHFDVQNIPNHPIQKL
jgi:dolichol-phosphate mannosyltransferase